MENQTVFSWFRRERAQTEIVPQPPQRPRGPPIRQASIALARARLLSAPAKPQQTPASPATHRQVPLPQTVILPKIPTATTQLQPPLSQTTITPMLSSNKQQPSPRTTVAETQPLQAQQKVLWAQEALLNPAHATNITTIPRESPKTVASPSPPATPNLRPIVTTRSPTPPVSPKVIETASLAPSPKIPVPRNSKYQFSVSEAETKIVQEENYKNGVKLSSNGSDEQYNKNNSSEATKHTMSNHDIRPPTSSLKNQNGKSFNSVGAAKKDRDDTKMFGLAGQNMGAMMNLSSPYKLHSQKYLSQNGVAESESASKDGNSSGKIAENGGMKARRSVIMVNSNVQCVNNSVLFNATCVHHSPGAHLDHNGWYKPKEKNSYPKKDASI